VRAASHLRNTSSRRPTTRCSRTAASIAALPLAPAADRQYRSADRAVERDAMPRLSESVSHAIRQFSFWIANRSVGHPLLEGIDYSCIFEEPSALEQAHAIFANTLELDEGGLVQNERHAERRAAQFIRSYLQPDYVKA
jgi:hypothetical protein